MAFIPPSSMPLPYWFMRQTATVTVRVGSQETAGSWDQTDSTTYTVLCNLQPNSSSDAAIYKRETSRTLYTLFTLPTATDGTAITSVVNHIAKVTIDSVDYLVDGEVLNLCSNDACCQINVYRQG
jgi:hypothetical protein